MADRPEQMSAGARSELDQLKRFWRVVVRHRYPVLGIWLLSMIVAGLVAYGLPNVYASSTMILVEPQKVPEDYVRATVTANIQERLKTISQQILSRTQIRHAVIQYELEPSPTFLSLVLERLRLDRVPMIRRAAERLGLYGGDDPDANTDRLVDRLKDRVEVSVVGRQAFSVTYRGYDPMQVMQVTNAMSGMFISENLRQRESMAEGTTEFLASQLEKAREELEAQEAALQEFKKQHMGSLPGQLETNLRTLDRLQMDMQRIDTSLAALSQERLFAQGEMLEAERQFSERLAEADGPPGGNEQLAQQLVQASERLADLKVRYTDQYPEVIELTRQVEELRARVKAQGDDPDAVIKTPGGPVARQFALRLERIKAEVNSLERQRRNVEAEVQALKERVEATPGVEQDLQKLQRDHGIMQENYRGLLEKQMDATLAESLERRQKGEQFRVIDPANLPVVPDSPNRILIFLVGLVGGLGAAMGIFIGIELVAPRFHVREDVTEVLGLPVLAVIPKMGAKMGEDGTS